MALVMPSTIGEVVGACAVALDGTLGQPGGGRHLARPQMWASLVACARRNPRMLQPVLGGARGVRGAALRFAPPASCRSMPHDLGTLGVSGHSGATLCL